MKPAVALACIAAICGGVPRLAAAVTAVDLEHQLGSLTLDPDGAYRVRDLRLTRGDLSIFFNEGVLMFAKPVAGKRIAAVFTTADTEAGDAEVLALLAEPSERASLASFTGGPNLNEHFRAAILFFADGTLDEINAQLAKAPLRPAPEVVADSEAQVDQVLQQQPPEVRSAMVQSLVDAHTPGHGPFLATFFGRDLGVFNLLYYPNSFEPVTIGRIDSGKSGIPGFRIWTGYRPRRAGAFVAPPSLIRDYQLDVAIAPNLNMETTARFRYQANAESGRAIGLFLSPRLKVAKASVNGVAVEVVQAPADLESGPFDRDATILLVTTDPLIAGNTYDVELQYSGSVVHRVSKDSYFVGDRAIWYPRSLPMLTKFDLTFRYPDRFHLVSTGELVDEKVANHIRIEHRRTAVPEQFAGFNLGEYTRLQLDSGQYHIDCYADSSASEGMNGIPAESAGILADYTRRWTPLPIHSLSVTPIPGYFGQGFPGLIYLSNISYVREQDRPPELRTRTSDIFFSNLLLPHEIAHQWWGNMVSSLNYRSAWITEAMANYSALQFIQEREGSRVTNQILTRFRDDLLESEDTKLIESFGPLDFGDRLLDNNGERVWHDIVYEKGAWVIHMLRERLGPDQFRAMQQYLLTQYNGRAITNDDFREAARRFLPADDPDPTLKKFFETWVYGTGIPKLRVARSGKSFSREATLLVSGVDDEFTADLPLRCKSANGREKIRWVPIVSGENTLGRLPGATSCELPAATEFLAQP